MRKPKENPKEQNRRATTKDNSADSERTIPGKRTPEYEKLHNRVVNEDEQRKAVNYREDNAQSSENPRNEDTSDAQSYGQPEQEKKTNEELETGDDQNEVNPRSPKVN